jgi:hypothetical protein
MPGSVSQITDISNGRDTPLPLANDTLLDILKPKIPAECSSISNPIFEGDTPNGLCTGLYSTKEPPGLFALCNCNQMVAKARMIRGIKLGYQYLW